MPIDFTGSSASASTPARLDKTVVIAKAREITGNKVSVAVGETGIPDAAILAALDPVVRDLSRAAGLASTVSAAEVVFSAVAGQQDYQLATYVAADVRQVTHVMRSAAHVPDVLSDSDEVEPTTGVPTLRYGRIPVGWQGDVMDAILAQRRANRGDRFGWEVVTKDDGDYLRLFPMPSYEEVVAVRYVTTAVDIGQLDEEAEACLVYAAVVAILDGQINRIMGDRATTSTWGEAQAARLKLLQAQRDRYEGLFDAERDALRA